MRPTPWGARWLMVALPAVLMACASPPPSPPPATAVKVDISALPNVNPDARGRPSPVVFRLYELKSLAAFTTADFFALFDKDKETIGADLVAREEFQLMPGDKRTFERKVQADTRYLGVIAAFRDLEKAQWRATMPVVAQQTSAVEVRLEASKVTINGR